MDITRVVAASDFEEARAILVEYAESLGFSLCFQGFDVELETLDTRYSPPAGALLLAREGGAVAGCVSLADRGDGECEMKRLYVRPAHRGTGLGRRLATAIIEVARAMGFRRMSLHTLPRMEAARAMYPTLGFEETATGDGPEGSVFMSLELTPAGEPVLPAGS
jgi:GNAT superfamily N-acetyltransferase